jgi:ERCC4-type nuclease
VLVSPTEPKSFRDLGQVSSVPEQYGVDFLWVSPSGKVGVQRKEVNDLVASLRDGRLGKELSQMESLDTKVVIVEGVPQWSVDGYLLTARSFTQDQMFGVLFSLAAQSVWSFQTRDASDTAHCLRSMQGWLNKTRHTSLRNRPKANGAWGTADNREWGIHLLQSFSGIGVDTAGRIFDYFGGVPLRWTVSQVDLQDVRGVGRTRAAKMMNALQRNALQRNALGNND